MMADSPWLALPRPSPRPAVATAPAHPRFLIRFAFGVKVKALTIVVKALTVERAFFPLWDQRLARKKPTIPTEATSRELKPKTWAWDPETRESGHPGTQPPIKSRKNQKGKKARAPRMPINAQTNKISHRSCQKRRIRSDWPMSGFGMFCLEAAGDRVYLPNRIPKIVGFQSYLSGVYHLERWPTIMTQLLGEKVTKFFEINKLIIA